MSVWGWIVSGIAAWLAVSIPVAVLVGRRLRQLSQQYPEPTAAEPTGADEPDAKGSTPIAGRRPDEPRSG